MDDRGYEMLVRLAIRMSNYWTLLVVVMRLFVLVGAFTVGVQVQNLLLSHLFRKAAAYRQVVRPMAQMLGIQSDLYSRPELDRIYRVFLRGLREERRAARVER